MSAFALLFSLTLTWFGSTPVHADGDPGTPTIVPRNLSDGDLLTLGLISLFGGKRPMQRTSPRPEATSERFTPSPKYEGGYCGVTEDGAPYTGVARY